MDIREINHQPTAANDSRLMKSFMQNLDVELTKPDPINYLKIMNKHSPFLLYLKKRN